MPDRFYDNTRIAAFKRCPRYYYFRHVRHWTGEGKSPPLAFGAAWHKAMDVVWQAIHGHATDAEAVDLGYEGFCHEWIEQGMPSPLEIGPAEIADLRGRVPGTALEMLYSYVEQRGDFIKRIKLEAVEKPFVVPLDPVDPYLWYIGRIDKVIQKDGDILGIEHKTTSAYSTIGGFRQSFLDSFSPNNQIDGYMFALRMLYGKRATAIWVDAVLVHKTEHHHTRIVPVERFGSYLDSWLWEVHSWIDQIEANQAAMEHQDDGYMSAWPMNTNSCWDFNMPCPYLDVCKARSDPHNMEKPPIGMIEKPWSPLEHVGLDEQEIKS